MYNVFMTTVTLAEARDHLAELLAEAARGGEVVIEGEDGSVFKLVPSEPSPKKKRRGLIGSAKGQIWMSDDFDEPLEDFEEYMR